MSSYSMFIISSASMIKIANEFKRSSANDDRKYVFIRFKAEKDRSAE